MSSLSYPILKKWRSMGKAIALLKKFRSSLSLRGKKCYIIMALGKNPPALA
ncbi:MAG: hypothetical protein AAGA60_15275 [Cyanobacteria bacterium P01_E01_bin.42]